MSGKLWCLCVINKIKQKTSQKSKSTGQSLPSASRPRSTSLNWDVSYHRLKFLSDSGEILEQIWGTNGMVAGRVSAPRGCTGQTASVCMTRLHHKRCTSDDSHCQRGDKEFELGVDVECVWVKGEKEKNKKKKQQLWARKNWEHAAQKKHWDQTGDMAGDEKTGYASVDGGDRRPSLLLKPLQLTNWQ